MNTYECKQCGMAVKATCGNCDVSLENFSRPFIFFIEQDACRSIKTKNVHISISGRKIFLVKSQSAVINSFF